MISNVRNDLMLHLMLHMIGALCAACDLHSCVPATRAHVLEIVCGTVRNKRSQIAPFNAILLLLLLLLIMTVL